MERIRPRGEEWKNRTNMDGGGDERWGTTSWGLWLKATSFLGNRSSVHVIRQGRVGGLGSIFFFI